MRRFLTVFFVLFSTLLADDASMTVVKKLSYTPSISVVDGSALQTKTTRQIAKMLVGDFKVSGHFKANEGESLPFTQDINYFSQKEQGNDLLLKLETAPEGSGLVTRIRLYDINANESVLEKRYSVSRAERYPFLAHKIASDVNDYINAPTIAWMQRFVVFSRYTDAAESEVVIADYTLSFRKTVVKGGLNIFPKWASDAQNAFYYTSYAEEIPALYRYDIYTGEKIKITESEGMLVCSDVSSDGSRLLLTMAPKGQPDIFLYDAARGSKTRLTTYGGIDVSAHFVDEESRFIFISDRLGYPNVFAKQIGGSGIEQMVYHGRNNNACSAHGKFVAYSSRESNNAFGSNVFNLYMVSTDSDYIRRLTSGGINQFPKFSSDGETILFIKHFENQSALGIIRWQYNRSFLFPLHAGKIQSIDW